MCSLMKKKIIILNIGIYSSLNTLFYQKEKEAEIPLPLFRRECNRPDVSLTILLFSSTEALYLSYSVRLVLLILRRPYGKLT